MVEDFDAALEEKVKKLEKQVAALAAKVQESRDTVRQRMLAMPVWRARRIPGGAVARHSRRRCWRALLRGQAVGQVKEHLEAAAQSFVAAVECVGSAMHGPSAVRS